MFQAGFARIDITPPVGCCLQGHFVRIVSTGVRDPLYAQAVVFDDGSTRAAIVSCDIIGVSADTVADARALIEQRCGIAGSNVVICATHTHTGPMFRDWSNIGDRNEVDHDYLAALPNRIASAVSEAVRLAKPTRLCCRSGEEHDVSFGRRYLRQDGSVISIPPLGDPTLVKALTPIDPEVAVVAFGEDDEHLHGLLVNFTLHLDTMDGTLISADFPGAMRDLLRRAHGGIGFLYTSGAMGNINHWKCLSPPRWKGYYECARRTGTILGGEVIKTVARMDGFRNDVTVKVARRVIDLPLKSHDPARVEVARQIVQREPLNFREVIEVLGILRAAQIGGDTCRAEIMAMRLGDIAFAMVPGELFVEFGLQIKKQSPFSKTLIIELANDYIGYIGTAAAYDEGGYETVSSALAQGAGEQLTDELLQLLASLRD